MVLENEAVINIEMHLIGLVTDFIIPAWYLIHCWVLISKMGVL